MEQKCVDGMINEVLYLSVSYKEKRGGWGERLTPRMEAMIIETAPPLGENDMVGYFSEILGDSTVFCLKLATSWWLE